jgi:hypothetical protein
MPADQRADPAAEDARRSPVRFLLGAVVVVMVGFWLWVMGMAFGIFDTPDNPDVIDAPEFTARAEAACAATIAEIDALPSPREADTLADRAAQVARGTTLTESMVAELQSAAVLVGDPNDAELVDRWLDDWEAYVDDRLRHVEKLETADPDASDRDLAFTLSERAGGGIYTRRIDGFATLNDMASCRVPGDV